MNSKEPAAKPDPPEPAEDLAVVPDPPKPVRREYRVTAQSEVLGHAPGSEFAATIPLGQEALLLESGALALADSYERPAPREARTYRVTAQSEVLGHKPNTTFTDTLTELQESQLLASGALVIEKSPRHARTSRQSSNSNSKE